MSDSREAYAKWREDRGIRIGDDPISATEFWDAAWQAAQAQAGDGEAPVAWLCDAGDGENINATCSLTALADYKRFGRKITPLYKKQPAQVNQQLLEALEAVLECGSTTDQWWVDQARAAIAAAQEQGK